MSSSYEVTSSSSSSSTDSDLTESQSSLSDSSSSLSSDWTYYSQFIRMNPQRTLQQVKLGFLLDLCLPDQMYAQIGRPVTFATWGNFAGQQIQGEDVVLADGLRVVVTFPRKSPAQEQQIAAAWYSTMIQRLRGALSEIRTEGAELVDILPEQYRLI